MIASQLSDCNWKVLQKPASRLRADRLPPISWLEFYDVADCIPSRRLTMGPGQDAANLAGVFLRAAREFTGLTRSASRR